MAPQGPGDILPPEALAKAAQGPYDGQPGSPKDMEAMNRPPPLRDGVPLTFQYADFRWPGCVITESTAIDAQAGLLMWWRHVEPGEDETVIPQASGQPWHWGGTWSMSDIAGIRYTTMYGDPGMEFLKAIKNSEQKQPALGRRGIDPWYVAVLVNPLSITMALGLGLMHQLLSAFPKENGHFNMSKPADENALDGAIGLAVACCLSCLASLWWLGLFSHFTGLRYKAAHLRPQISSRWWWQKGLAEIILEAFFCLCLATIMVCIATRSYQYGEQCHDRLSDEGRRLLVTTCIKQDGVEQSCGVNGCSCGMLSDLLCSEPPLPEKICMKVMRPLCAADDSGIAVSGMHGHLLNTYIATQMFAALNGFNWFVTGLAMVLTWSGYTMRDSKTLATPKTPEIQYHRFTVIFNNSAEPNLTFSVDSREDPEAVASMLAGEES
eukprot:TRINITY_DN48403_c0_g1_i1.p1 TRINITY_DN48403_c0_g1~~TRINITY_DN48403_c0_g1_i1.p1  ORF type:complete len:473 (-),score=91.23 TRINITY_DN48403_c0_g1_i1:107-1417(-)